MDIYAWSSGVPNLGDDLNHWLWKRVLPESFLSEKGTFIGIGSVINSEHLGSIENPHPIHILGAGCRDDHYPLRQMPQNIHIHAVRGPLSSTTLRLKDSILLLDAAYSLRFADLYQKVIDLPKRYDYTLITYFKSKDLICYNSIIKNHNVNVLHTSDYGSIEYAVKTIAQSRYIISESLHGAIIADLFRVPWLRLNFYLKNPSDKKTAEYKWTDWFQSMEMNNVEHLEIPFRMSSWRSKKRNLLLKPLRTLDYNNHFSTNLKFRLSSVDYLDKKLAKLERVIQSLRK